MPDDARPTAAQLRAAKDAAKRQLAGRDGVEGVGIGDGCVRIYVRAGTVAPDLPRDIAGVPVWCIEVGAIAPQAPPR